MDEEKLKVDEVIEPHKDPIEPVEKAEEVKTEATSVEASTTSSQKKPKKASWAIWVLVILVVVVSGGYLAYAGYGEKIAEKLFGPAPKSSSDSSSTSNSVSTPKSDEEDTAVTKVVDEGVTWKTPVKLDDLGLFIKNASYEGMGDFGGATYYSVGSTSTGAEIIAAIIDYNGLGSGEVHRFLKKAGVYTRLTQNSSELVAGADSVYTTANFKDDTTFYFKSLSPDKSLINGETALTYQFDGAIDTETGFDAGTKMDDTKWGDLKLEKGADAGDSAGLVKLARYYIKLNDSTKAYYSVSPTFLRDDRTFSATFTDVSKKTITFDKMKTSGCGGGTGSFPLVAKAAALTSKVEVAKTAGSKIYNFADLANELNVFGYKIYTSDQNTGKETIANFVTGLGLVVWIDAYGSTVVYTNSLYAPLAECGKPVIYLYPTTTTPVSVKVGADVTVSDPAYGSGWNVIASPSGLLTTDSGLRTSLFWEGIGKGVYPQINSGTVVAADQALNKIKTDLAKVGLNNKEITDFTDFWAPKLPSNGSVRLSWFFNEDMNKLAPLQVSPKPDSVIRVFLDFASVDAGSNIKPQSLPTYARNGFTLVEWGGLLRK